MIKDLHNLPEELRAELKPRSVESQKMTQKILDLFENDKPLDLDCILIMLFRKYNILKKRVWLVTKLRDMRAKNLLEIVPRRRGLYIKKCDLYKTNADVGDTQTVLEDIL